MGFKTVKLNRKFHYYYLQIINSFFFLVYLKCHFKIIIMG